MDYIDGLEIRGAGGGGGGGKDGGGGGQSRAPVEAPNSLFSVAFAKSVFLLSEGEVQGFPTSDVRDIFLDGTPIKRADGTENFKNVVLDYRSGTDSQTPMSGFSQVENTVGVATTVSRDIGPVTRTITNSAIERCRVIIQHPSLQSVDTGTGDTNPTSVTYRISLSANGGPFITKAEPTVSGKSSGQFQRAYEFALTGSAPWQVKVERLTADSTSSFLSNSIVWQAYTEIVDDKFAYPNSAVLGVKVDARQFNNIPDVKVRLRGKRVQIPSNYNPAERTYTGLWDGTFQTAWTDNPAWIFRDLCLNPVYGVRRYLPGFDVDRWTLYQISQYCDELVPNGQGGTEPRFRCNVYLQNSGGVFEVLNGLASVFRGLISYAEGKLFLTQDRPGVPVQQFSEANVIQEVDDNGLVTSPCFVYQGTSRTARKSVVLASWDDPAQNFNQVTEYLQDDELLKRFGYLPTDLRLLGVTSRGQALRAAKFALFTNRYLTDKVTFRIAAEGLAAGVGEVIQIADPLRQGQRIGGRIKAINGNSITLDTVLELNPAISYTATLVSRAGTVTINGDGTTSQTPKLTSHNVLRFFNEEISGEFELYTQTSHPIVTQNFAVLQAKMSIGTGNTVLVLDDIVDSEVGSIWVLEWQDLKPSLYRILSISEASPLVFTVDAIPYNASAYGYIDNSLPVALPKDRFTIRDANPPTDLSAKLDYRNGRVRIFAKWNAPQYNGADDTQVSGYRYEYRQAGSETWSPFESTAYTNADVSLPQYSFGQVYEFRVASRNRLGQQSNWLQATVSTFDSFPDLSDPKYNASIRHQNQPDGTQLLLVSTGTLPLSERVVGFKVWAKPLNATGPIPGVQSPGADGYYILSDNVALSGYYGLAFHAPADYSIRVALRSAVPGEEPVGYLYDTVFRAEIVPPKLENFTVIESQDNKTKRFSWQVPKSTFGSWANGIVSDITLFKVRYKQGSLVNNSIADTWAIGMDLFAGGIPASQTQFETALIDNDQFVVLIKAIDATKWESDEAAYIILNTQPPLVENVVQTGSLNINAAENQFFNCSIVNGKIQQTDITQDAYFNWLLLSSKPDSNLLLTTTANATYQHFLIALMGQNQGLLTESGNTVLQENGNDLYLEQDDFSGVVASDTAPGILHPYAPMEKLGMELYRVRTMFRSNDGTTPGTITGITYTLDYSDLLETFNDVVLAPTTGSSITLTKPFKAVKGVQATIQDTGTGAISVVVTAKSTSSVTLKALNAAGAVVSAKVDVVVQGY